MNYDRRIGYLPNGQKKGSNEGCARHDPSPNSSSDYPNLYFACSPNCPEMKEFQEDQRKKREEITPLRDWLNRVKIPEEEEELPKTKPNWEAIRDRLFPEEECPATLPLKEDVEVAQLKRRIEELEEVNESQRKRIKELEDEEEVGEELNILLQKRVGELTCKLREGDDLSEVLRSRAMKLLKDELVKEDSPVKKIITLDLTQE